MEALRRVEPGVAFAHKVGHDKVADLGKTVYSRRPVIEHFRDYAGHLHLLTMPGQRWPFEQFLLTYRRGRGMSTQFTSVERDPEIYQLALAGKPPEAEFENTTVEDLIARCNQDFTGAWLDFSGPLTPAKLKALSELWLRVNHSLVVTFMAARCKYPVKQLMTAAGGWDQLLMAWLKVPPNRCHTTIYLSPSVYNGVHHVNKMVQITLRRRHSGF